MVARIPGRQWRGRERVTRVLTALPNPGGLTRQLSYRPHDFAAGEASASIIAIRPGQGFIASTGKGLIAISSIKAKNSGRRRHQSFKWKGPLQPLAS